MRVTPLFSRRLDQEKSPPCLQHPTQEKKQLRPRLPLPKTQASSLQRAALPEALCPGPRRVASPACDPTAAVRRCSPPGIPAAPCSPPVSQLHLAHLQVSRLHLAHLQCPSCTLLTSRCPGCTLFTSRRPGCTLLTSRHLNSYDAVLQNSASLDFSRYAKVLMERIFLLRLPQYDPVTERAAMNQHFHGENLTHLNATMHRNLQTLLTSDILLNRMDWKQDGLFRFCYSLLFRAGYLTLFGSGQYSSDTVYDEFRRFDGLLTKMARTTLKPGTEWRNAGSKTILLLTS
ncbi:prostacyclin synthase-like [Brienomyrus brachyistius]|uniref:prostacyclin synthase-like n=1 Tax=Brienomyrus brachyistius TaxID=42636 RepID=UPI0020B2C2D6|nr:prostacyclin synthase-like [Brienomyrus brachyistius]